MTVTTSTRDQPSAAGPGRHAAVSSRPALLVGLFVLGLLTVVWSWWAWQEGAWFGVVRLPGTIILSAALVILAWVAPWPGSFSLNRPSLIALVSLLALGAWAAVSALWSPAPDVALADAQRIFLYGLAFGLGIWMAVLLGSRVGLSLIPLAAAGLFAGCAAVVVLLAGDDPASHLGTDGSLQFPLGYRNANAAFFAVAFLAALGLASARDLDWRLRALALGAATICLDLGLLSQSRGSAPAAVVALVVYVLVAPFRLRAVCWLGLAILPALGVIPALTDLYRAANDEGIASVADQMSDAGIAVALTAAAAVLLGAIAALLERRLPRADTSPTLSNRVVLGGTAAIAVALAVVFVARVGDPVDWVGDRVEEFKGGGTPDLSAQSSRFGFNVESDRYDLWRVALDDTGEDPLLGDGGGGFQYTYLQKREVRLQTARDAHSIELEVLSELGVPGLVLLLAALGGAAFGAFKARRLRTTQDPEEARAGLDAGAASLAAAALTCGAYWLSHTSIDWFWSYPAITAPVLALLGAACGAAMRTPSPAGPRRFRPWITVAAIVLALSAVPPFLSERYVNDAYAEWRSDLNRAYDDLDRAQALNPFSDSPLLAEGAIADAAGDRRRALAAFREAEDERPEEWATHYLLAELLAEEQPDLARRELEAARELNPLSIEIEELEQELRASEPVEPE
jgi:O-Antigen ligase